MSGAKLFTGKMGAPRSVPTLLAMNISCRVLPMLHTSINCRRFFSAGTHVTSTGSPIANRAVNGRRFVGRNAGRCLKNVR